MAESPLEWVLSQKWNTAFLPWVCSGDVMNEVVDRILNSYELMRPLSAERVADSRQKVSRYLESLASAGQRDAKQLVEYGLAYLKELHEG